MITDKEYRSMTGISQSDLFKLLDSPQKYLHKEELKKETREMLFGTAFHVALLEPKNFLSQYGVMPTFVGMTKDGRPSEQSKEAKEKKAAFLAKNPGKIWLTEDEMMDISGMLKSVANNRKVNEYALLQGAEVEKIMQWKHGKHDCKGRLDVYNPDHRIFGRMYCEVKTAAEGKAHPSAFAKEVHNRNYDGQGAFYDEPLNFNKGFWLVVEKVKPYICEVYEMDHWLVLGRKKIAQAFDTLEYVMDTGDYYGYTKHLGALPVPAWLAGSSNEENILNGEILE